MRAEEMLCLAILPEDLVAGIGYALQSLHYTFDRMRFGDNEHRRFYNIALGKSCEATLVRFLRQHGIPHLSRQGATPHTQPDHFDLRVMQEIVDLKTFKVPQDVATPSRLLDCLALVPDHHARDQWARRQHYQRYLFGYFAGELRLQRHTPARQQGNAAAASISIIQVKNMALKVLRQPRVLYVAAAPSIAECEQHFSIVAPGSKCTQYPGGTRIRNRGCPIAELTSFNKFLNKMDDFRRR